MIETADYRLKPTRLQEKCADGTTRCHLCLWRCRLRHGQRGFCQAHVNREGTLYNLTYGILSSIEVGPIEAKPVRRFRPGTRVLSVGSYGCSFRCEGCHNLEISWGTEALDALARGQSKAAHVSPEDLVQAACREGVEGIAFTYSEPAVWLEYVLDVAECAHEAGLYTVYVSNSFVSAETVALLKERIDVLCSDIKSTDDAYYRSICGKADVASVLSAIKAVHDAGIHVETRTNLIPGKTDDLGMIADIAHWIREQLGPDSPWHLTRFFPAYRLSHLTPTPRETLEAAGSVARAAGLRHVYIYGDKGCDCAMDNRPVHAFFDEDPGSLYATKKCAADCCGDEGVLLKKYESEPRRVPDPVS